MKKFENCVVNNFFVTVLHNLSVYTISFIRSLFDRYRSSWEGTWIDAVADKTHHSGLSCTGRPAHSFTLVSKFFLWTPWHRPPAKESRRTVSSRVTWLNPTIICRLTVTCSGSWCPMSEMTMIRTKSSVFGSLYKIWRSLLKHMFLNACILLSASASGVHVLHPYISKVGSTRDIWIVLHNKPDVMAVTEGWHM